MPRTEVTKSATFFYSADCEIACKGAERKVLSSLLKAVCSMPKARGPCKKNYRRFYYDNVTNTCPEFEYSGCGGNENQVLVQQKHSQVVISF